MTSEQLKELVANLMVFVERASKNPSNEAEVEALPGVARVLADICKG